MWIIIVYLFHAYASALDFKWKQKDEKDKDDNYNKNDKKWHFWGAISRFIFGITPIIVLFPIGVTIADLIIGCSLYLFAFDMFVNKFALNMPLFYPGASTKWDVFFGKKKWIYYGISLLISIIIKIYSFDVRLFNALDWNLSR